MTVEGAGDDRLIVFRTNVDDVVALDADHPLRVEIDPATGTPSPYILVRDRLAALIARSVFYDLVDLAEDSQEDGRHRLGLRSGGQRFLLSSDKRRVGEECVGTCRSRGW